MRLACSKKKFWTAGGSYHYHHGMAAGENTLDTILCRLLVDSMVKVRKGGDADNDAAEGRPMLLRRRRRRQRRRIPRTNARNDDDGPCFMMAGGGPAVVHEL